MILTKHKYIDRFGFSIIEICIVCAILLILLIPIFSLLTQGNAGTVHNRNEIIARQYVANIIAYYNLIPYSQIKEPSQDEIKSLILRNKDNDYKINLNDLGKDFENFKNLDSKTSVKVKEFKNQFFNYKVVSVSVDWKEPGKKVSSNVSMSGMITQR